MDTEPADIGSVAWRIWNALVNGEGLPLELTSDEIMQLTEMEQETLGRIASRKGFIIEYHFDTMLTTVRK